jgi:hypothetical protein
MSDSYPVMRTHVPLSDFEAVVDEYLSHCKTADDQAGDLVRTVFT